MNAASVTCITSVTHSAGQLTVRGREVLARPASAEYYLQILA